MEPTIPTQPMQPMDEMVEMEGPEHRFGLVQIVWLVAGILVIVAGFLFIIDRLRSTEVKFPTPYQAVLLTNGAVYFGKLEGYGGPHPVLTQVYYIVTETNPQTNQKNNVLVKRGKELHEPDRMYLNPNQILFVEPVGQGSPVAQKISESGH